MTAANVSHLPEPPRPKPKKKVPASVAARQAEAEDGYATVEYRGVKLRVPIDGKIPIAVMDAIRDDDVDDYDSVKLLLGDEQWKALSAAGMLMEELGDLVKKVNEVSGN